MPPSEEGKEASEQLFRAYTDARSENSVRRRWVTLVIGLLAVICVVACLIWAEFLLRPGPYDDMVRRLHPGMSSGAVIEELGNPSWSGDWKGHPSSVIPS